MFGAATFCMNTMSILSALADSGFHSVGNVVFPLTFPELMIGEDEDSHVALFEATDRWYEYDMYGDGNLSSWDRWDHSYDEMWDDIEAAQRQADRDEDMKAAYLRGEWDMNTVRRWRNW